MDYLKYDFNKGRNKTENSTDPFRGSSDPFSKSLDPPEKSIDQPRIDHSIITWLRQIYPIRRYSKELIADTNFALVAACEEGRQELIDRIEAEFNRQYEVRKADKEI